MIASMLAGFLLLFTYAALLAMLLLRRLFGGDALPADAR